MTEDVSTKIDNFFSQYRVRKYPKGQILILNGDEAEYIYRLIKGRVKQYDVSYRGDEIILNVFKPSAFFPMSLAINKGVNPYIYEAETAIEVRQAPANEVVGFMISNPDVTLDLLSRVYHGVDGLLGRMVQLMSGGAASRLIYELVIECRRFGEKAKDGSCHVSINEGDLAARSGLSRETVSREMRKLSREGLARASHSGIHVNNLPNLQKKLGLES